MDIHVLEAALADHGYDMVDAFFACKGKSITDVDEVIRRCYARDWEESPAQYGECETEMTLG